MKSTDRRGFSISIPVIQKGDQEPLGVFSPVFNCSIGIILVLATLVVMGWLPVAVGAVCMFIYMKWRNQGGFQGPSLNMQKLSQNLPPDAWVSLI